MRERGGRGKAGKDRVGEGRGGSKEGKVEDEPDAGSLTNTPLSHPAEDGSKRLRRHSLPAANKNLVRALGYNLVCSQSTPVSSASTPSQAVFWG